MVGAIGIAELLADEKILSFFNADCRSDPMVSIKAFCDAEALFTGATFSVPVL